MIVDCFNVKIGDLNLSDTDSSNFYDVSTENFIQVAF